MILGQIIDLAASKAVGAKTSVVQVSFSVLVLLHTLQFIIILVWPVMTGDDSLKYKMA